MTEKKTTTHEFISLCIHREIHKIFSGYCTESFTSLRIRTTWRNRIGVIIHCNSQKQETEKREKRETLLYKLTKCYFIIVLYVNQQIKICAIQSFFLQATFYSAWQKCAGKTFSSVCVLYKILIKDNIKISLMLRLWYAGRLHLFTATENYIGWLSLLLFRLQQIKGAQGCVCGRHSFH